MEFKQGDRVRIEKNGTVYEGRVMPSMEGYITIKMDNGYNAGFSTDRVKITLLEGNGESTNGGENSAKESRETGEEVTKPGKKLPKVAILSTGGTIASKVDYRTGAVTSQFTADDILAAIPELKEIADFKGRVISSILSENMDVGAWEKLASAVVEEIKDGADGIIITHGTDTMMYTAAALSFMIETPVPIVLVGSQRSADRPSSDSAMNAICAARVAVSDIAEVSVVMHGTTSDDYCEIHRGTKVRKMHTSRRDAFKSINSLPIGTVDYNTGEIKTFTNYIKRGERPLKFKPGMEPKCALVKFTPDADPDILDYYIRGGYRGLVLEGTGLGHVSTKWVPLIQKATDSKIPVVVTSQCLNGRVCDRVYNTGRDMLKAGAIEGEDTLPETALVKLMWVLGQTDEYNEAISMLRENLSGEITECCFK
ncbi:glutamyl-tRNA(Gln) amidotransferase subunit D [Methanosarcina thermophila]|jgi:glutamyl-tRNA(Gln) amidotransferase subunit D|uniref:Glutamyl-tRNA(Gln) amidotransferase subunit D n=3 Tax=Methanosarcina thermophila TaxID=2210 RepID=A0A1I6Y0F5_METTE|nr:Glu-tRNA(Gln) amidotransferase subunit GatD [Methanosarcina thermophila]ALK05794.1 MAG: glutamyl-tRNA amidotransferase [Methanosarcina sp. 795]AKB12729.1 Glutamyl-tRNA(Gln) amidotransferase asparaginase subunit [Methanosarcina thermophila TM-1]AKB16653.1 Glutamyl-tRNA(Gln) amidotransferase asparaginase subunit [Methanosarcina thermophila CHTI-55]NLU56979.1 Glu-tRNA(Gln) amidotransferase subunit GatD [Methanosarcina thermophila]SFT43711.1 glutamyl-tRNA(Gln) amidotransferase subunit D [Methan